MGKTILFLKNPNEYLKVKICAISSWEGFDELIAFLQAQYNIEILKQIDGPDARRWILKKNDLQLELIHDDMSGNYLVATSEESELLVNEIGKELELRLDNEEN